MQHESNAGKTITHDLNKVQECVAKAIGVSVRTIERIV